MNENEVQDGNAATVAGTPEHDRALDELRSRFREAALKNKELTNRLAELESEVATLRSAPAVGGGDLDERRAQLDGIEMGLKQRETAIEEKERKLGESKAKLEDYVASLAQTRENLIASQKKQKERDERSLAKEKELEAREEALREREMAAPAPVQQPEQQATPVATPQPATDDQLKKYQDMIIRMQGSLQAAKSQLMENINALQNRDGQVKALTEEKARLEGELAATRSNLDAWVAEAERLRNAGPQAAAPDDGLQNRVRELEAQLGTLTEERQRSEELTRTVEELRAQIAARDRTDEERDREIASGRSRISELEEQSVQAAARMEEERARFKEAMHKLRESLEEGRAVQHPPNAASDETEGLRREVEEQKESVILLKGSLGEKDQEIMVLKSRLRELEESLKGFEGAVTVAKFEEAKEALKEYYQKELADLRAFLDESNKSFEERESALARKESELIAQKAVQEDSIKAREEELSERSRHLEGLAVDLERRENDLAQKLAAMGPASKPGPLDDAAKKKLQDAVLALQQRVDDLSKNLDSTASDLEGKEGAMLKLQDALFKMRAENGELQKRLQGLEGKENDLIAQLTAQGNELAALKQALIEKESELAGAKEAMATSGKGQAEELERAGREIEALKARAAELEVCQSERERLIEGMNAEKERIKKASHHLAEREEALKRAESELDAQRRAVGMREGLLKLIPAGPVSGEPVEEQYSCPKCSAMLTSSDMERGRCPSCGTGFSAHVEEVTVYECPSCSRTLTAEAVAKKTCPFCSAKFKL